MREGYIKGKRDEDRYGKQYRKREIFPKIIFLLQMHFTKLIKVEED